jgi:ATP-dependent Clp protease ATP-binding subunit ClpA
MIIIMTSNLGAELIKRSNGETALGFGAIADQGSY